jgi:thiopeptide-type bacteriocin biosynthesis protein
MDTARADAPGRRPGAPAGRYVSADFFLLRVPALPLRRATDMLQAGPEGQDGDSGWEPAYTDRVLRMWRQPHVRAAVSTAAPDLAQAIERLGSEAARDRRRAVQSLGRYLNRMSVRPTPFGLMAGVAAGTFGAPGQAASRLGDPVIVRPTARPDMGWLLHLSRSLATTDRLDDRIEVRTNDLIHEARGRVWLPSADAYGANSLRTVSVRLTGPARTTLELARSPVPVGRLRELLADHYPAAPAEQIAGLVGQLIKVEILMTASRPRLVAGSGDTGLLSALARTCEPDVAQLLRQTEADLAAFNAGTGTLTATALQDRVKQRAGIVTPDYRGCLLQIDSSLGVPGGARLPGELRSIAEQAADVLTRVGATYQYPQVLRDYAAAFTERYGAGAEIGVLEMLCTETGLGPPAGYQSPPRAYPLETQSVSHSRPTEREEILSRLVSTALARRSTEIELDKQVLTELQAASGGIAGRPATPGIDVHLQVIPPEGTTGWRGVVVGAGVSHAGRTAARFYHLLDGQGQQLLRELARAEEERTDGLTVELTYLPAAARAVNVSVRPPVRQWELPVNVAPSLPADRVLSPQDVRAGVRDGRFYLRSARLGREINVSQHSMLSPLLAPNFCRFLIEVSGNTYRGFAPFQWGNLDVLMPFLPRLVWRDVVIKRARWRLRRADVGAEAMAVARSFAARVREWAGLWMAPHLLYLTEEDNHILIDMRSAVSLEDLRSALARADSGYVELEEALPTPAQAFLTDARGERYAAEVVIPVLCDEAGSKEREPARPRSYAPAAERFKHLGTDWLYLKLYTETEGQDGIVLDDLPVLTGQLGGQHGFGDPFFVRYGDPAPHLRVRFRVPAAGDYRAALGDMAAWASALTETGRIADFSFATYHREVERYGGPELIALAENLFCLDSRAVRELLAYLRSAPGRPGCPVLSRPALAALSLERIGGILTPALGERLASLRTSVPSQAGSTEYRAEARLLWTSYTVPGPAGEVLGQAEQAWRDAGDRFLATMGELESSGRLWSTRREITASLLHMHGNRMGLSRSEEETAHGIWRRLLGRVAAGGDRVGQRAS